MNLNKRNVLLLVGLLFVAILFFVNFDENSLVYNKQQVSFSQFLKDVEDGYVSDVQIQGNLIRVKTNDNNKYVTYSIYYPELVSDLKNSGVNISALPPDDNSFSFLGILVSWLPILLLIGVYIFFMKQMQSGSGGRMMGFGKSKAVLLNKNNKIVKFSDVAGVDEAKHDLQEIIDFLKDPAKYAKIGARVPKGVLLFGPPGTGKTLLAKAVAGESNVPFFSISGSDFVEMFVGVGASRVRDMFEQGKANAPCIIFIDEIDAMGRHRGTGIGGGNDEREQTLNQLLVEMDGFSSNTGVIIMAATNRSDVLDPALLRPGRFDRQVVVSHPDLKGREEILKIHLKKIVFGPDVDPKVIARGTPGFSGADLENLVNESALFAASNNKKLVTMENIEYAKDKIMMGAERKTLAMSEEEKELTAYHEAGHAIVAINLPDSDPVHKVTIIPRGSALGMVMRLPERDSVSMSRAKAHADLAVAMAGRVAEEIFAGYSRITSGASSDIRYATKIASNMVQKWGMSDKLGMVYHTNDMEHGDHERSKHSDSRHEEIDSEIKKLLDNAYKKAKHIIESNRNDFEKLAKVLFSREPSLVLRLRIYWRAKRSCYQKQKVRQKTNL